MKEVKYRTKSHSEVPILRSDLINQRVLWIDNKSKERNVKIAFLEKETKLQESHTRSEQKSEEDKETKKGLRSYSITVSPTRYKGQNLLKTLSSRPKECGLCSSKFRKEKIVQNKLVSKYGTKQDTYNTKVINETMFDEHTHFVAVFKDYLVYDDADEFLKRFYSQKEQRDRLNNILSFYDKWSQVFPNYIPLLWERKYMFKNIENKQRAIDEKEALEGEQEKLKSKYTKLLNTKFMEELDNTSIRDYKRLSSRYQKNEVGTLKLQDLVDVFIAKDSLLQIDTSKALKDIDLKVHLELANIKESTINSTKVKEKNVLENERRRNEAKKVEWSKKFGNTLTQMQPRNVLAILPNTRRISKVEWSLKTKTQKSTPAKNGSVVTLNAANNSKITFKSKGIIILRQSESNQALIRNKATSNKVLTQRSRTLPSVGPFKNYISRRQTEPINKMVLTKPAESKGTNNINKQWGCIAKRNSRKSLTKNPIQRGKFKSDYLNELQKNNCLKLCTPLVKKELYDSRRAFLSCKNITKTLEIERKVKN